MTRQPQDGKGRHVAQSQLLPFFAITFGLAWGIMAMFIFLPDQMLALFGELTGEHPLFYLAVYSPAIAAFVVVWRNAGATGLRRFLGRAKQWRCNAPWYAFILLGIPVLFFFASAIQGNRIFSDPIPFASPQALLMALGLAAIKGPVEELGWRGLALPLLQRGLAPAWAGLVLGVIWAVWHFPAFLLSGTPQGAWSFAPFFVGSMAVSVIMTALYNRSRGSIFLAALFHFQLINPLWPDAQPHDMYLFAIAAGLVLWFNRRAMFSREGAHTEILALRARSDAP